MKMTNVVKPEQFISGVGHYTQSEMLFGLHWLGATDQDLMSSLSGLGAATVGQGVKGMSAMDAIIHNAAEMNYKVRTIQEARMKAAKADPKFALQLNAAMKKRPPGTNVAAGVISAAQSAAQKAAQAKSLESKAAALLKSGDKRAAAAQSVNALTAAREALVLSTSAEKTRLTSSLQQVAHTLDSQASYVEQQAKAQVARSGQNAKTYGMNANALQLRAQAQKLRNQAAVVQATDPVPANAPTQRRIADVTNKFNLRQVGRGSDSNVMSVLSDLSDSPMAKVRDYDGAMSFYGNDQVGRLMCDMEFDNHDAAIKGLRGAIHGMGYVDTLPVLAQSDAVLAAGVAAAQQGFTNVVLPAYTGQSYMVPGKTSGQSYYPSGKPRFSGLGALGADSSDGRDWNQWCDANAGRYGDGKVEVCKSITAQGKSKLWPFTESGYVFAPWTAGGKLERTLVDFGGAAALVGEAIVNPPPPAPTLPPKTLPGGNPFRGGMVAQPTASQQGAATGGTPGGGGYSFQNPPSDNTMYAVIAGGAIVLGTAVYWTMFRRPSVVRSA